MMHKIEANDPLARGADGYAENVRKLKELFPELVTEGPEGLAVNVDALKSLVGDSMVTDAQEKFGLNWHGKRAARQLALTPSLGTLRPCKGESVDWDTTQNLMIEGDNLEALKLLKKSYAGKVKLIYIDPPYNTGKDFVYPDDFRDGIENYKRVTQQTQTSNPETSGRFHTDWLNMMYPRLKLARELLREDGVVFISIDDGEVANLTKLCEDVFGAENRLNTFVWKKGGTGKNDSRHAVVEHEYILAFARSHSESAFGLDSGAQVTTSYNREDSVGRYSLVRLDSKTLGGGESMVFEIKDPEGRSYWPEDPAGRQGVARWRWSQRKVTEEYQQLVFERGYVYTKNYEKEGARPRSLLADERYGVTRTGRAAAEAALGQAGIFDFPKPLPLVRFLVEIIADRSALVLDFFAGSGTTGHAVWAQNVADGGSRRYLLVQLPEPLDKEHQQAARDFCSAQAKEPSIAELTRARLRGAAAKIRTENPLFAGDLGFRVFKLDSTNIAAWDPKPADLGGAIEQSLDHLKTDRGDDDVLYEILLKHGLDLSLPIAERSIAGKTVYSVGAGTLLACLDRRITRSDAEPLALGMVAWLQEMWPDAKDLKRERLCIFRDAAFASDDVAKTNLAAILEQNGLADVRSL